MKNKTARALAIVALVFMLIFSGSLIATLVDSSLMNGGIGYLALSSGAFSLVVFFALRADGKIVSSRRVQDPTDDEEPHDEKVNAENEPPAEPNTDGGEAQDGQKPENEPDDKPENK